MSAGHARDTISWLIVDDWRLASERPWTGPGPYRGSAAGRREEGRQTGVTVWIGSGIAAGYLRRGRENGRSDRISGMWLYHVPVLLFQRSDRLRQTGASVAAQPKAEDGWSAVGNWAQ